MEVSCPSCRHPIEVSPESGTDDGADLRDTIESVDCPNCGLVSISRDPDATQSYIPGPEERPQNIAHFSLIRRLGGGGFGSVWLAHDNNLERDVALKLPHSQDAESDSLIYEARTAATLQHPGIVSIYEVGCEKEQVFIACELIEGLTLRDQLSAGRPSQRRAVEITICIADALQHAHENSIIHRDVKPANILIDRRGNPCITDFGLAKRISAEQSISAQGQILGTARYMSPEQAAGKTRETDHRSDIYSVGVILFEMLTGGLPFRGNLRAVLHQKMFEDAPSPRTLEPSLPRDLETICLKCLERDPARRYASARDVADELRRFLAGEPIHARAISSLERGWRWCVRRPALAALIATVFFSLTIGLFGVSAFWLNAEQAAETNFRALYRSQMNLASEYLSKGDIAGVSETLDRFRPTDGHPDLRGFEWHYFNRRRSLFTGFWNQGSPVTEIAISRDGRLVATTGSEKNVTVFDAKSGDSAGSLSLPTGRFRALAFSPTADQLACGASDGVVRIWNPLKQNEPVVEFKHGPPVSFLGFSKDGRFLMTAAVHGAVRIRNGETDELVAEIPTGEGDNLAVELSPSGRTIAVAKSDGRIRLTDVESGVVTAQWRPNPGLEAMAWSPDESMIAVGGYNGSLRIWSVTSGEVAFEAATTIGMIGDLKFLGEPSQASALAPAPALAVVGVSGQLLLLETGDWTEIAHLPTHNLSEGRLDLTADGRTLVIGSGDGSIRLLESAAVLSPTIVWHDADVRSVAYSDNGSTLTSIASDGSIRIRMNGPSLDVRNVQLNVGHVRLAAVQPGGPAIAIVGADSTVALVAAASGEKLATIPLSGGLVTALTFSRDGRLLGIAQRGDRVLVFSSDDWTTPRVEFRLPEVTVAALTFSPNQQQLALACSDQSIRRADLATRVLSSQKIATDSPPVAVEWCDAGHTLAIGTASGLLTFCDVPSGRLRSTAKAHTGRLNALSVLPNGTTLISGGRDRVQHLWDTITGERLTTLSGHSRQIFSIAVSPDGTSIASGALAGDVRLWQSR